ncbi:FecR domain-containing protein [Methylotenera versatilis]|uniref:FecR domain-containing protein n=1 Tax=Methylotenera versatilis TaxID=1055487 RepID=UPI0006485058|nr:FecR domain-containing protein [Methylotenera versatilis]
MSAKPNESLIAASRWFSLLSSEEAKPEDFAAWQRWKDNSDENRLAWQRVEDLGMRLASLPPNIHAETFAQVTSPNRRHILKQMAVLLGVGTCTLLMVERKPWQEILADQTTATGDMRALKLPDGSQIFINTASAINIDFTSKQRSIKLIKGEILIHTAQELTNGYRPFSVTTKHGTATALGTKFNVRMFDYHSKASVYEGAVRINPADKNQDSITIQAGQSAIFDENTYTPVEQETSSAWAKGLLVVYSMPLNEFVAELSRYRNGLIRCEPSVSQLLVSGSFYTNDTDAVLARLPDILPVKIQSRTRYWVTISPA